ncbi:MAG TPA: hypothetical protein GXX55_03140 [Firmicutes bacterium]|nr:hypothetical protein [Bacillota bacterium]
MQTLGHPTSVWNELRRPVASVAYINQCTGTESLVVNPQARTHRTPRAGARLGLATFSQIKFVVFRGR